jgi:hypothetical protein
MSLARYEHILNRQCSGDPYEPSEGWGAFGKAEEYWGTPILSAGEYIYPPGSPANLRDIPARGDDFSGILTDILPHQKRDNEKVGSLFEMFDAPTIPDTGDEAAEKEAEVPTPQERMGKLGSDFNAGKISATECLDGINDIRTELGKRPVIGVAMASEEGGSQENALGFISVEDFPTVVKSIFDRMSPDEREALLTVLLTQEYGDLERAEWRISGIRERPKNEKMIAEYEERKKWRVGIANRVSTGTNDRTGKGFELRFEVATSDGNMFSWALYGADAVTALEDAGVYDFKSLEGKPCYYEPEGEGGAGTVSHFKKFWKVV